MFFLKKKIFCLSNTNIRDHYKNHTTLKAYTNSDFYFYFFFKNKKLNKFSISDKSMLFFFKTLVKNKIIFYIEPKTTN